MSTCDYCNKEVLLKRDLDHTFVEGKWYSGHKSCMEKIFIEKRYSR